MYLCYHIIQQCVVVCSSITLLYSYVLVYVPVLHFYRMICWCSYLYYPSTQCCVYLFSSTSITILYSDVLVYVAVLHYYTVMCRCMYLLDTIIQCYLLVYVLVLH